MATPGQRARSTVTRAKVIEATVSCILDEGFYRASSNRIAERSGVTWGVIQYHFGTREALLAAVYEDGMGKLATLLEDARIEGDTVEDRLDSFADIIWSYFRQPRYVAHEQLALNLRQDPHLDEETRALVIHHETIAGRRLAELASDVLAGTDSSTLSRAGLIQSIRSLAVGLVLTDAKHRSDFVTRTPRRDAELQELLAALALLIRSGSPHSDP